MCILEKAHGQSRSLSKLLFCNIAIKMNLRQLVILRKLSTTRILRESFLCSSYKSEKLWDERFQCKLLGGEEAVIKTINTKIITGKTLSNWELDIFTNISKPQIDEIVQLQESAKLLEAFRKTLYAHTLLPSTHHAVCRLFLYSQKLPSLVHLLENRVKYGIFPDFFAINLLLDHAIEKENYMLASRLASLVMLQEEFGCNPITDRLSLLSLAKYIESRTSFEDWVDCSAQMDPVIADKQPEMDESKKEKDSNQEADADEDEDEEDAEYVRVPFLRNPYFDNHFDLNSPRVICGKTLTMLGQSLMDEYPDISARSHLLGGVLQGKWSETVDSTNNFVTAGIDLGPVKETMKFYVENINDLNEPDAKIRELLLSAIDKIPESSSQTLSELAHSQCKNFNQTEENDVREFKDNLSNWSKLRLAAKQREEDILFRKALKAEIEAKKEELRLKEQYLYFFDNLKKKRATRIEYD